MTQNLENTELLTGIKSLSETAIIAVSEISESLHQSIYSVGGVLDSSPRTRGITGLVYQNIRTITRLSSKLIDPPLRLLGAQLPAFQHSVGSQAVISALNGVLGDHLHATGHPFALNMSLRYGGEDLSCSELATLTEARGPKINLFIHGLCMNDVQWRNRPGNYPDLLEEKTRVPGVFLCYNTGMHISQNGELLARLLEQYSAKLAPEVKLNLITHSMGGLVARAATHYGQQNNMAWPNRVQHMVFLGTPHQGAPLEKVGHWVDRLLELSPYSRPFIRLTGLRSHGINDLREGFVTQQDWHDSHTTTRTPVPLPEHVTCTAFAASLSAPSSTSGMLRGDGLVPVKSALGKHHREPYHLGIPAKKQHLIKGANHMDLLNHPRVAELLMNSLQS